MLRTSFLVNQKFKKMIFKRSTEKLTDNLPYSSKQRMNQKLESEKSNNNKTPLIPSVSFSKLSPKREDKRKLKKSPRHLTNKEQKDRTNKKVNRIASIRCAHYCYRLLKTLESRKK